MKRPLVLGTIIFSGLLAITVFGQQPPAAGQASPRAQVEVVAHENTKANMERMPVFRSESGKVGLPDRTFKDRTTLFSGKDAVDLYYFGAAHTNGDIFVVFRDAHVMHAGDVFARKDY